MATTAGIVIIICFFILAFGKDGLLILKNMAENIITK